MATSTNYGWSEPDNSSLVKDGAQAIRTLGDAIDTSVWNVGYGQAGKNKVINGSFDNWQRGTSFSFASTGGYTSDRFLADSGSGGTVAVTRQTFTAGQTDVPNAVYFYQAAYSVSGTSPAIISTRLEDVNTLAAQTATFSFYAKVNTGTQSITPRYVQDFGSGGSTTVVTNMTAQTLTTSWQRFTISSTIPSVTGKTIGTSSYLRIDLLAATSGTLTYQIANLQLEYGSKATPFQTASGGSPQAELAMCQRYYWRITGVPYWRTSMGSAPNTTQASILQMNPVPMRVPATAIDYSTLGTGTGQIAITDINNSFAPTALSVDANASSTVGSWINATGASGLTQYRNYFLGATNGSSAYIGFSAEL